MPVELDSSYEAIYQRAVSYMSLGQADRAIEELWRIIHRLTRLRPETLQRKENLERILLTAWSSLVAFLRWEQRYDDAISACEAVRGHLPAEHGVERRIASLTIERGDTEEGLGRFRQAVEHNPSMAAWADLGAEYAVLGRYDEAESGYKTALALAESNEEAAMANIGLFRVYQETDRLDEALNAWSMVAVLDPDMGDHVSEISAWLIERCELDRAAKYLGRERDAITRTFYQGLLDWQAGLHEAAHTKWRSVLAMDVEQEGAGLASWMEAALRLGSPQTVLDKEEALTRDGTGLPIDAAVRLAFAHAMRDQVDEAKSWLEQVIQRLERGWPRRSKIEASKWRLLDTLITDPETVQSLSSYFDTGEGEG